MPPRRAVYFQRLDLGMNTRDPARRLQRGQAQDAKNVDLSGGTVKKRAGTLRRGTGELNSGVAVLALHEFNHLTNGTTRFAHAGTKFYILSAAFAGTTLGVTADAGAPASTAAARDFLIIANRGTSGKSWIWDGTSGGGIQQILGDAPSGTPTFADGGAGNLTDGATYTYKFTLYSNTHGFETAASAAFSHTITAGSNQNIDVTLPAGYTNALGDIWDRVRVYRGAANNSTTLYLHSAQTASFTDSTADVTANATFSDPLMATPPACNFAVHFHDRAWLAGAATTNGNKVYVSDAGVPGDFPAANVLTLEDRRAITGMHEFADMLFVGTDRSISIIRDIDRSFAGLILRNRTVEYGFASHFAIKEVESRLWFLDPTRGVCRMDSAGNVEEVSREILDDLTKDLEPTRAKFAYMEVNEELRQLWLSVTLDAGAANTRVYKCQYDQWHESQYGPQPAWTYGDEAAASMALMTGSDGNRRIHIGTNDGFVHETNRATRQDGTTADIASGTATGGSTTTLVDSGAPFPTAGDALKGVSVTIKDATDDTYYTATITNGAGSSSSTIVFADIGFTVASGDSYWIGPIDTLWKSGSDQLDDPLSLKHIAEFVFTHKVETHTDSLDVGHYLDEASAVTNLVSQRLDDTQNASPVGRKRIGVSAYAEGAAIEFRSRGSQDDFEILDVAVVVDGQLPRH